MARPSKEQRLAQKHEESRTEFDRVWSGSKEVREQCRNDRRFATVTGGQWEGDLGEQFENKPRFEINKTQIALQRIYSEYRNNRITADFLPKDGSGDDELADVCDGLYRADEEDSCAEEAYDNAFDEGTTGGIGAWRLRAEYENEDDDEDERQRIRFEPIFDADTSVFFNIDAKRQDKSDAKRCWVIYSQDRQSYIDEWDDDPSDWPKDTNTTEFDWCTPDLVYLAEYYEIEEVRDTVHVFLNDENEEDRFTDTELMEQTDTEDVESAIGVMAVSGMVKLREKRVKRRKVHKYIMSGSRILEDCGYIAGKHIPVIIFYGKRWFVDGIERAQGHTRLAKDTQRIKNMQYSKLGELVALSSTQKPILTPEQVAGHHVMWAEDNLKDYPYLLINPVTDAAGQKVPQGPVAYTKPPDIPPALAALLQISETDMMDILGRPQDATQLVSNTSGKAVEMIQKRLDMQAYLYTSNFAKAVRRCAEVWLSMAKELYVEENRDMKMIGEMGNAEGVRMMEPVLDEKTGEYRYRNDLSTADFDLAVDVGPSFASRRDATVQGLQGVMQYTDDPGDRKILSALVLMNMEGEGLTEVREYYRKQLVGMGVLPPNEEEREAMEEAQANQEPDPQTQFLLSEAEKNMADAQNKEADTMKKLAETDRVVAETDEIDADTAKTLAETAEIQRGRQ